LQPELNKSLKSKKSFYYALGTVLLWSTVASAFKLTLRGMNNVQLLFYSSLTSLVVLFFIARKNSSSELSEFFTRKHFVKNAFLGFINPFVYYLILFKAYFILPAQEAQPIVLIWPLIFSVLSAIFLKQKLTSKSLLGMLISFSGVIVVATRGNIVSFTFHNLEGDMLALLSAVIWASFWILNLFDKRDESVKLFGSFFFGTIYITIYIFLFDSFVLAKIKYLLGAVYVGLFEMGLSFFFWLKALSLSENKAKTANLIYLFPVISLFFISFVLGEKIYFSSIAGLVLIMSGIIVQQISGKILSSGLKKIFK
jgi:drug/metabolite transporter (DMT)-like permease